MGSWPILLLERVAVDWLTLYFILRGRRGYYVNVPKLKFRLCNIATNVCFPVLSWEWLSTCDCERTKCVIVCIIININNYKQCKLYNSVKIIFAELRILCLRKIKSHFWPPAVVINFWLVKKNCWFVNFSADFPPLLPSSTSCIILPFYAARVHSRLKKGQGAKG